MRKYRLLKVGGRERNDVKEREKRKIEERR